MPDLSALRKYIRSIIGAVFVAAIIYFLGCKLYQSWSEIPFEKVKVTYSWAILSFSSLTVSFVCMIYGWQGILRSLGQEIGFRRAWWVVTGSFLAKYIPGHVWVIGGRIYLCKKEGISEKISGTGVILEMIAVLLGALLVFLMSFFFLVSHGLPWWIWLLLIPIPVMATLLFGPVLPKALKLAAERVLKKELKFGIHKSRLLEALGMFILSSILQGGAFYFLIRSVYPLSYNYLPDIIGIYNGSWAIGFLSFITPAGLGVREGVLTLFLNHYLPLPMAIIIAALTRLWMTVFEMLMALVGLKFMNKNKNCYEKEQE